MLKIIASKTNQGLDDLQLLTSYGLQTLAAWRVQHHLVLMYRLKQEKDFIDTYRPPVMLRNSKKMEFKLKTTSITTVRLWDRVSEETQKATTKVKFKNFLAYNRL